MDMDDNRPMWQIRGWPNPFGPDGPVMEIDPRTGKYADVATIKGATEEVVAEAVADEDEASESDSG